MTAIQDRQTFYQRAPYGWVRTDHIRLASGATGWSHRPCSLNINQLVIANGMNALPRVDWLYRSIMWLYQHIGLRRLFIWYKNMED